MDFSSYVTVLPIIVICYAIGLICKTLEKIPDKWIPVIVSVCGGLIAIPGMTVMPDFPATDIITAVSVGIMSGLASTGVNQVYKQVRKAED